MTKNLPTLVVTSIIISLLFFCCSNPRDIPREGVKTVYFPQSDDVQQTVEYKNSMKNGYLKEYYRDGSLKARQFYVNDTLNDSTLIYHPGGKLKDIQVYKNKLKHGCWRAYNKEGRLYSEMFFKNGFLDSTCSNYSYRSLHLLTRITYKEGLKNGTEEHFYPGGKPRSKTYYDMGQVCKGTQEWYENGKPVNNDFKINISEKDAVLLNNTLTYTIRLQDPQPTDKVYQVVRDDGGIKVGALSPLIRKGDAFVLEINVSKGSFVMDKITIAAFRKTGFGNTFIKTQSFNAASNNF